MNRGVKFGLKIPNRLGKMSENVKGDCLTRTVQMHQPFADPISSSVYTTRSEKK